MILKLKILLKWLYQQYHLIVYHRSTSNINGIIYLAGKYFNVKLLSNPQHKKLSIENFKSGEYIFGFEVYIGHAANVFVSGLYILQIEEIEIASDSKNRLQFIIIKQQISILFIVMFWTCKICGL